MDTVTIRDLRNRGGEVIDRVAAGERLIVTRAGTPVAELRPLARRPLNRDAIWARWRNLPYIDPVRFREDVDELLDPSL